MTPPAGRRTEVVAPDGCRLAVVEVGGPAAPPVVVAHGVGSSARFTAAAFASPVLASGRRLVTYDQRGHGQSSSVARPEAHTLDRHVADLTAVVAALGVAPSLLVGVSLGAHAVVRAAASTDLAADAVVACLPAWSGRARVGEGPHAAIADEIRTVGVAGLVARLRADTAMPGWLRTTLLIDYPRHDPASLAAALLALDGGEAPTLDEVAALPVPLGVVGWPDDPGHPLAVASAWARAADGALVTLRLGDLDAGLDRLGAAALAAADTARDAHPGTPARQR
ncbi:alpha/beta fold hydrolase [Egicoccus sp. AB-alg2]|uniref:alpha/beta fold hydrolase n=1 Tax=Egicoccus sp. AB-alg2 TaxID=3242693 RepID=UPI00359EACE7